MNSQYRLALVTGASRGIGADLSQCIAKEKIPVILVARDLNNLKIVAEKITMQGGVAYPYSCDVNDPQAVAKLFETVREKHGFIDLFVANAGVSIFCPAKKFVAENAAKVIQTNVLAPIYCLEPVLQEMVKAKKGHIVAISSLASYVSMPVSAVYCASKTAISFIFEGLALELPKYNVDTTVICPGFIKTDLVAKNRFRMPFVMESPEAAERIWRAIKQKKSRYNFPMPTYLMTKAISMVPFGLRKFLLNFFSKGK